MGIKELITKAQTELLENQDGLAAETLLLKAAKLGSCHAAHELGVLYSTGCNHLKPNPDQAEFWLKKSLESGFEKTIASDSKWFER